jgi:hypothetical protein
MEILVRPAVNSPTSAKRLLLAIGLCLLTPLHVPGQQQTKTRQEFDVASIKPNNSGLPRARTTPFVYSQMYKPDLPIIRSSAC